VADLSAPSRISFRGLLLGRVPPLLLMRWLSWGWCICTGTETGTETGADVVGEDAVMDDGDPDPAPAPPVGATPPPTTLVGSFLL